MDSSPTYRPDIDGLRAVAVISVMIYHLNGAWLPGGFVGVDIFFVISGFVVTGSLLASRSDTLGSFIAEFYARRLARILPALVVVLVATALAATAFIPNAWLSELSNETAKYAFFGLSNYILQSNTNAYFAPRAEFNPYTHTWSLGVEEQFYLVAPLLVFFWVRAVRRGSKNSAEMALGGLLLLAAVSLTALVWWSAIDPAVAFYFIGCRLWELMLGVTLFLITVPKPASGPRPWPSADEATFIQVLGAVCVMLGFLLAEPSSFPWPYALLPALGTVLIIQSAAAGPTGPVRSVLAAPTLVWIGKRSYSLYLWHWPVLVLMRWTVGLDAAPTILLAVGATVICSIASYRWVERPLRHDPWIERRPRWLRIAGFLALPVVGFLVVSHVFDHAERFSLSTVTRNGRDWYAEGLMRYADVGERRCKVATEIDELAGGSRTLYEPSHCGMDLPSRGMFVLGDSHAAMIAPMLDQISAEQGITVRLYEFPGCTYIDFKWPMNNERPADCQAFTVAATEDVLATAEPGDIIFLSSLLLERYGDQWGSFDVPDMYALMYNPDTEGARQAAYDDAVQWLQRFAEKDLQVVFMAPTPIFRAPAFRCSDWFNAMNPICVGKNEQPRADLARLRQPILDSMASLARTMPNVHVWDPFPLLCPDETCRTEQDGRPLFFDGDHLSAYGNLVIYPAFRRMIAELR